MPISDEDKALFRAHMETVKPLRQENTVTSTPSPKSTANSQKTEIHRDCQKLPPPFLSDYISTPVQAESTLKYCTPSLPSKRLRELKQGKIPREATLDLHGFTTEAARDAFCHFIQTQYQKNARCLLIIHGKGGHERSPPVIKNLVNRWLPQFEEVLAFHSAQPQDGGHGAVYVLLKKLR